jgi:hypothetical protein
VSRFKDVRDKIFAHKELADRDAMNAVLARSTIDDLKAIFGFLHALESDSKLILIARAVG